MIRKILGISFSMLFAAALPTVASASSNAPEGTNPKFVTIDEVRTNNPSLYYEMVQGQKSGPSTLAATTPGWGSGLPCGYTISLWNRYYGCALHQNPDAPIAGNIKTILISPVFSNQLYPVQTLLYVFNTAGTMLGYFDTGYFQVTPQAKQYDISAYNLPMTSKFQMRFRINGGGSATILNAPTIQSTYISVSQ
jgi:hypothetical protein